MCSELFLFLSAVLHSYPRLPALCPYCTPAPSFRTTETTTTDMASDLAIAHCGSEPQMVTAAAAAKAKATIIATTAAKASAWQAEGHQRWEASAAVVAAALSSAHCPLCAFQSAFWQAAPQ